MNTYEAVKNYLNFREKMMYQQSGGAKKRMLISTNGRKRDMSRIMSHELDKIIEQRSTNVDAMKEHSVVSQVGENTVVFNFRPNENKIETIQTFAKDGKTTEDRLEEIDIPDVRVHPIGLVRHTSTDAPAGAGGPGGPVGTVARAAAAAGTVARAAAGTGVVGPENVKKIFSSFTQYGITGTGGAPDPSACTSIATLAAPILLAIFNSRKQNAMINTELLDYLMRMGSSEHTANRARAEALGIIKHDIQHYSIEDAIGLYYEKRIETIQGYLADEHPWHFEKLANILATKVKVLGYYAGLYTCTAETQLFILNDDPSVPCGIFDSHGARHRNDGNPNAYFWIFPNQREMLEYYQQKYVDPSAAMLMEDHEFQYGQFEIGFIQNF